MDFHTEVSSPTLFHPISYTSPLFLDNTIDCLDCDHSISSKPTLLFLNGTETCMNYTLPSTLPSLHLPPSLTFSASHPAPPLLEVCSHTPSPELPCSDVEAQVEQPPSTPERVDPVAPVPAPDRIGLSRPGGSNRPPWPLDLTRFPRPSGSPFVSRHTTSTMDLRISRYAPFLPLLQLQRAHASLWTSLSHTAVVSVLGYSGSASVSHRCNVT